MFNICLDSLNSIKIYTLCSLGVFGNIFGCKKLLKPCTKKLSWTYVDVTRSYSLVPLWLFCCIESKRLQWGFSEILRSCLTFPPTSVAQKPSPSIPPTSPPFRAPNKHHCSTYAMSQPWGRISQQWALCISNILFKNNWHMSLAIRKVVFSHHGHMLGTYGRGLSWLLDVRLNYTGSCCTCGYA